MAETRIGNVAVVGAGMMGCNIGTEYAIGGHQVTLFARSAEHAERATARVRSALDALRDGGVLDAAAAAAALGRVRTATTLPEAVAGAELIVESIPENLALKREMFVTLETLCAPGVIFATNTSGLPITQIATALAHPERLIGVHYLNPAHLMPPVEVIPGEATAPEIVERMRDTLTALGKSPVVVRREEPGFLWNRLQFALLREACHIVEQGIATMEEVDLVMRQGLGRRWSIVGPFASLDLGGIGTAALVAQYLLPALSDAKTPPPTLAEPVAAGRTGAESGGGFYDWPPEKLQATVARRNAMLVAALRAEQQGSDGEG